LKKAIKLDSTEAKYWLKLGALNYAMQDSRSAKDCWELCCHIDATNIDCRINLAEMYLAVGELEKGQKRLNEILNMAPKNSTALYLSGNYALIENDTIKGMKYIQAAINFNQYFASVESNFMAFFKSETPRFKSLFFI
jgi:tetratricopeptide (TPR) repeat protein